jgi:catechol 2,3-dioxygenase-like lactoylglutathione lyase family enzyme
MSLELGHLGRIVLLVNDFQLSVKFYRDRLGLRVVRHGWRELGGV